MSTLLSFIVVTISQQLRLHIECVVIFVWLWLYVFLPWVCLYVSVGISIQLWLYLCDCGYMFSCHDYACMSLWVYLYSCGYIPVIVVMWLCHRCSEPFPSVLTGYLYNLLAPQTFVSNSSCLVSQGWIFIYILLLYLSDITHTKK